MANTQVSTSPSIAETMRIIERKCAELGKDPRVAEEMQAKLLEAAEVKVTGDHSKAFHLLEQVASLEEEVFMAPDGYCCGELFLQWEADVIPEFRAPDLESMLVMAKASIRMLAEEANDMTNLYHQVKGRHDVKDDDTWAFIESSKFRGIELINSILTEMTKQRRASNVRYLHAVAAE